MHETHNILLEAGTNELEVIEFYIDELLEDGTLYRGSYGINVAKILEIIHMPILTKIPTQKDSCMLGTFNLRGRIIPLIDIASWLHKKQADSVDYRVIVCEFSGSVTAFLVSGVERIYRISWGDVEAPTEQLSSFSAGTVLGVIRLQQKVLFLLDMEYIIQEIITGSKDKSQIERIVKDKSLYTTTGGTLLFADDSLSIRNVVRMVFETLGYTVLLARDGSEALNILEGFKEKSEHNKTPITNDIQCVITDIEMPEVDGHTLVRKIKEDVVMRILPTILYSSIVSPSSLHKGEKVGANAQVSKVSLYELVKAVHTMLH